MPKRPNETRGRPPLPEGEARVSIHARVAPDTREALERERRRTGESLGKLIDRLTERIKS